MHRTFTLHLPAEIARLPGRRMLGVLAALVATWWSRARERRALARLDDRELRDIGLTRCDAAREAAKPFWQP